MIAPIVTKVKKKRKLHRRIFLFSLLRSGPERRSVKSQTSDEDWDAYEGLKRFQNVLEPSKKMWEDQDEEDSEGDGPRNRYERIHFLFFAPLGKQLEVLQNSGLILGVTEERIGKRDGTAAVKKVRTFCFDVK